MFLRYLTLLLIGACLLLPRTAQAIPPPDFLFSIGSQLGQIFSLLVVALSAVGAAVAHTFRPLVERIRHKKLFVGLTVVGILAVSITAAWLIDNARSNAFNDDFTQEVEDVLDEEIAERDTTPAQKDPGAFFEAHRDLPIAVTNEEFRVREESGVFVLDAREDEEYDLGRYPGSTHIRFADLLDGAWTQLPTDRIVTVFCWSGIRGSTVAEFLRSKGVVAQYIKDGADGWVKDDGTWDGEIAFSSKYSDERYKDTLSTGEVREAVTEGAILVDARSAEVYEEKKIDGSINISVIFTPSDELDALLDQVPADSQVITVCDDFVSCFDAKIVGIKLEYRGHTFLGRYAEPWKW